MFSLATQPILRAIGRVVGSDVLTDAVAFFQAFAGMDVGFRDRAEAVTRLLRQETTRFVIVAAPQREVIDECAWFADQLGEQGFEVSATIVNRLHPRFGDGSVADAEQRAGTAADRGDHDLAAIWSNLAAERQLAEAQRAALAPLVERTADVLVEVPLLPDDVHDVGQLDVLATHLFA